MNRSETLGSGSWPDRHHLGGLVLPGARERGQRPFVTFVDDDTGERTELGWVAFENWTAKAANLLVDDLGLGPGDVLGTDLGTHWTTLVVQVAAWRAGLVLALPGAGAAAAAWAMHEGAAPPAGVQLVTGRGMGGRLAGSPGSGLAFAEEVLAQPDGFDDHLGDADDPAVLVAGPRGPVARSHADLLAAARNVAAEADLPPGERHVSALASDAEAGLVAGPVLALANRGGVVLARGFSPDRLAAVAGGERCGVLLVPSGVRPLDVPADLALVALPGPPAAQ